MELDAQLNAELEIVPPARKSPLVVGVPKATKPSCSDVAATVQPVTINLAYLLYAYE